jgi:tetratricopeptide (TPR) repeat protein
VKRTLSFLAVIGIALAMFVAGSLGPFAPDPTEATSRGATVSVADLSSPAGGARGLDATIAVLQAKLVDDAENSYLLGQLGLAYLTKGRLSSDPSYFPKAEKLFEQALALDAQNLDAMVGSGLLANAQHRFAEGLGWGKQASEVSPYDPDALGVQVDSLVELGRYKEASSTLQRMVDQKPDLASYSRVAYLRELNGDVAGAIAAMSLALDATTVTGDDAGWVRVQLGDLYFNSGRLDRADEFYGTAAEVAPELALADVGLARVAAARGDLDEAIELMTPVVERYPTPQYVSTFGDLYTASGDPDAAATQYALVDVQRKLFTAGGVLPDVELTVAYADRKLRPAATVKLGKAQYRARQSVRTADALGWALYAAGETREAERYAREALRLGDQDASYYFHAGMIASANGDEGRARRLLERSLDINPYFSVLHAPTARTELDKLTR